MATTMASLPMNLADVDCPGVDRGGREGYYSAAQDPAPPEDGPLQARLLWRTGRRLVPPS